jgi:hypothetical protein
VILLLAACIGTTGRRNKAGEKKYLGVMKTQPTSYITNHDLIASCFSRSKVSKVNYDYDTDDVDVVDEVQL